MDSKNDRTLSDILSKVSLEELESLFFILRDSNEYSRLQNCTQMRDEVIRDENDFTSNRYTHTIEVAQTAGKLTSLIIKERNNGRELTDDEKKENVLAVIIGLAHDFGHTPMGHDTEEVFSEQISQKHGFSHDKYSGVVIANLFDSIMKDDNSPKPIRESKQELIQKLTESGVKDYIIKGVQNHGIWYASELEGDLATDLPLQCGRLGDTLSFMLKDLHDLSQVDRAVGAKGKILTKEQMMDLVENGIVTEIGDIVSDDIERLPKEKLPGKPLKESLPYDFDYEKIIDAIVGENNDGIEKSDWWYDIGFVKHEMLKEVARYNVSRGNKTIITIPDNIKRLRETIGNFKDSNEDFSKYTDELDKENDAFRKECPILSLIYEIQDEFVYNQILYKNTQVLGNDTKENKEILNEMFARFEQEYELLEDKSDFRNNIFPNIMEYMPFDMGSKEINEKKAYAIHKMQSLTNKDIDAYREQRDCIRAIKELHKEEPEKKAVNEIEGVVQEEPEIGVTTGVEAIKMSDYTLASEIEGELEETNSSSVVGDEEKNELSDEIEQGENFIEEEATYDSFGTNNWKSEIGVKNEKMIFGVEAWKEVVSDRGRDELKDMLSKVTKIQSRIYSQEVDRDEGR